MIKIYSIDKNCNAKYTSYVKHDIGKIMIKATEKSVVSVQFVEKIEYYNVSNSITEDAKRQLEEYFEGRRKEFNIAIGIQGTEFQNKVWKELIKIRYGEYSTYSEVAKNINNEKAVRATGTAIGKNPILIIIPCHRVIAKGKKIGGFTAGVDIKKKLLDLENIKINDI